MQGLSDYQAATQSHALFSQHLSKDQVRLAAPGAARVYKRQIVKELKSAIEKDSRNEKQAAQKQDMMKYWKAGRIKLEEERKDLMDLYFSQTQGPSAWKSMQRPVQDASREYESHPIKVDAMDTQESVSIYDEDVN